MITFRQPFVGSYNISLDYGEKFPPLYTDESPHRGIDYLTPMGTEILASESGTVSKAESLTVGYGKYVTIMHADGYRTIYAHLSEIKVRKGQTVNRGDVIGLSGTSGNSTGPHLHFELQKNNIPIDPKPLMQSVIDNYAPFTPAPKFEIIHSGLAKVVCDVANVRCHCDMSRVIKTLEKDSLIYVGDSVTLYNGLPYREYYDTETKCFLRIAEHDPYVQIIKNMPLE